MLALVSAGWAAHRTVPNSTRAQLEPGDRLRVTTPDREHHDLRLEAVGGPVLLFSSAFDYDFDFSGD